MDKYRESIQTPRRNRSFVQGGRINEDLISRVNYQNQRNSVQSILKFAIILFTLILLFFITGKAYNSLSNNNYKQNLQDLIDWVSLKISRNEKKEDYDFEKKSENIEEKKNENKEGKFTEEEILRKLGLDVKACMEYKKLKNDLKYQNISVSYNLPLLPNYEAIKQNPGKFGISNEINRKIFSEDLPEKNKLENNFGSFNKILPFGNIGLNSDKEDFENVDNFLESGNNKYENLDKLLDDDYVHKIQMNVNDIGNSYKNLLKKQKQLNSFRKIFVEKMNELSTCKKNLFDIKSENDKNRDLQSDLNISLKDLNFKLKKLLEEIDLKINLLNEEKRKKRLDLSALREKIQDLEMILIDKEKIRAGISAKKSEIEASKRQIANLEKKISDWDNEKSDLSIKINNLNLEIPKAQNHIRFIKKQIEINSAKLQVLQTNSRIKEFLDTLINKNAEVDDLALIMESKIGDEKELLKEFQIFYKMISNSEIKDEENKEGVEITYSIEGGEESIIKNIDNDKKNYKEISSKFLALRRELEKYENLELSISKNVVKIQNLKNDLKKEINDLSLKTRLFGELGQKLKNLELQKNRRQEEILNLLKFIKRLENEIERDEKKLLEAEQELKRLKTKYDLLNKKFNEDFSESNKDFEKLENDKKILRMKINDILEKLKLLKIKIHEKNFVLRNKTNDCAVLLLYFNETSKILPGLVENFENDKNKMNVLKKSVIEKINLFDNFN